ncbi:MAG: hypothetical protein JW955_15515 [Sedimentisphaerales bacterium]|nr:hypothetical protein [Sedimentisphaerales bacterium]
MQAPVRICVLVKVQPDSPGGSLVTLRSTLDGKVLLGCLADASGKIREWLELRVQCADVLMNSSLAKRVTLSNGVLDGRWHRQVQAFEQTGTAGTITCGWETTNPPPTFLDVASLCSVHPRDEQTGAYWQLCRDEAVLHNRGLPPYAGSLHRYLYLADSDPEAALIPVTDGAPANDHTGPLSDVCPHCTRLIPFNPTAGLMLITRHYVTDIESFLDALAGVMEQRKPSSPAVSIDLGQAMISRDGSGSDYPGRLFLDAQGKYSRLIETFHLKLALLSGTVAAVHSVVRRLQRPFLNLSEHSFRVNVDGCGSLLPFLWNARAALIEPGDAVAVSIETADLTYYLSPLVSETSVYRPAVTSLPVRGRASLRIRRIVADSRDAVTVEGTLATHERIELNPSDLVLLQVELKSGHLCLHAHLATDSALAADEYRFRTVSHKLLADQVRDLRGAEGVPMSEVPFEVIPLLSSPCDLYSLAILAVRTLLVDHHTSLPTVVDEMLSLARQVQTDPDAAESLEASVERVFRSDPRWLQLLGPHHLAEEGIAPEEALGLVPEDLWWSTLATIVRMFPGLGPASLCRDYGDARPGGLHLVFERVLADLDALILKTRCLVTPDLRSDMQIAAVIHQYVDSLSGRSQTELTDTKQ